MPAVSNTSPLLNLAIIDRLSLLRQQFGLIQIPTAVLGELRVNELLPGSLLLREAIEDGWIQVLEVSDRRLVRLLRQLRPRGSRSYCLSGGTRTRLDAFRRTRRKEGRSRFGPENYRSSGGFAARLARRRTFISGGGDRSTTFFCQFSDSTRFFSRSFKRNWRNRTLI